MDEVEDLKARADDLNHRIEEQTDINTLLAYSRRSRRLAAFGAVLSLVLAVTIVVLGVVVMQVRSNAQTCSDFNKFKAGEAELWGSIFDIPPRPDQTAEQKAQAAVIEAISQRIFAPSDCNQLLAGGP